METKKTRKTLKAKPAKTLEELLDSISKQRPANRNALWTIAPILLYTIIINVLLYIVFGDYVGRGSAWLWIPYVGAIIYFALNIIYYGISAYRNSRKIALLFSGPKALIHAMPDRETVLRWCIQNKLSASVVDLIVIYYLSVDIIRVSLGPSLLPDDRTIVAACFFSFHARICDLLRELKRHGILTQPLVQYFIRKRPECFRDVLLEVAQPESPQEPIVTMHYPFSVN